MRIAVVGRARPARRGARPRVRGRARDDGVRARRARHQRHRRGGGRDGAGQAGRHPQRGGVHQRRRRRGSADRGAEQQRLRGAGAGARGAGVHGATLVHYSTDFVFDGTRDRAVRRDRPAESPERLRARRSCSASGLREDAPRAYVLRVEGLFGQTPGGGPAKGSAAGILESADRPAPRRRSSKIASSRRRTCRTWRARPGS